MPTFAEDERAIIAGRVAALKEALKRIPDVTPEALALVASELFQTRAQEEEQHLKVLEEDHPATTPEEIADREKYQVGPHRNLANLYRQKAGAITALFTAYPEEVDKAITPVSK